MRFWTKLLDWWRLARMMKTGKCPDCEDTERVREYEHEYALKILGTVREKFKVSLICKTCGRRCGQEIEYRSTPLFPEGELGIF